MMIRVLLNVLLLSITQVQSYQNAKLDERPKTSSASKNTFEQWYSNIPFPPVALLMSGSFKNSECKSQLQHFRTDLQKGLYWAVQMFDSSVKYPTGMLYGTTFLGNFDECYQLNAIVGNKRKDADFIQIKGKYCLVDFKYEMISSKPNFNGKYELEFKPNESAWEAVKEKGDFRRAKRYQPQIALCVPSACSNIDVENALTSVYNEYGAINNLNIKVSVNAQNCQTVPEEPVLSNSAFIFCAILVINIGFIIAATICYKWQRSREEENIYSTSMKLLLCFSLQQNLQSIFQKTYTKRSLDCINMVRFVFTCFVIFGHRAVLHCFIPLQNVQYLEKTLNYRSFVLLHNGTSIVDGFFSIAGLLASYGLLCQLAEKKRSNFFIWIADRFIRFTPAYAVVVFFFATLFPYLGSGPLWKIKIRRESEFCAMNWWTNLLYINNYVKADKMCIFQTWYLSADFHFYIMALFLVYIFWRLPRKVAYSLFVLLLLGSIAMLFYISYVNQLHPIYIPRSALNNLLEDEYFVKHYITSHYHLSSYLVGLIFGALLYDLNPTTYRVSKISSNILFILSIGTCVAAIYCGLKYFDPNTKVSAIESALYASLHRSIFATGVCGGILLLHVGSGLDTYKNVMSHYCFQPLGRLSYGVFLSHGFIHLFDAGTMRNNKIFSAQNLFWNLVPDVFFSYCISLLLTLCVEGPFRKIEKVLLGAKKRSRLIELKSK